MHYAVIRVNVLSPIAAGDICSLSAAVHYPRETGDPRFLETARATADNFLAHLPADHVLYWDFQAAGIPAEPRGGRDDQPGDFAAWHAQQAQKQL